jgi:hypothetical protein
MNWLRDAVPDEECLLVFAANSLACLANAPDDRPSPGVIVHGDLLLISVLTSLKGNAVRRRTADES